MMTKPRIGPARIGAPLAGPLAALATLAMLTTLAGCPLPDAQFKDPPGSAASGAGGAGGASSTSSADATTGAGGQAATSSSSATSGGVGGGDTTCTKPGDCPSGVCTNGECQPPTCTDTVKNGSEIDVDCGGADCPLCPTLLLIAGGSSGGLLGEYHPGSAWTTSPTTEKASYLPGLVITSGGTGISTIEYSSNPGAMGGPLRYNLWTDTGGFGAFANMGAAITARGASMTSLGANANVTFFGDNSKHYYAAYKGGAWSPSNETVGMGALQSFGPSVPAITSLGQDFYIAFAGNDGNVYDQRRTGGSWDPPTTHDTSAIGGVSITPAIVALTQGAELMIVFNRQSDGQLYSITRSGGVWAAPKSIAGALSKDPVALLAFGSGAAGIAFRGTDSKIYIDRYLGGAWLPQPTPIASPNPTILSTPAAAPGLAGAVAELVYIDMTGAAYHTRLVNNTWTAPTLIGGSGLMYAAIASSP